MDGRLNQSWWALRMAFGLVPIVAGLDKFFNLLTDWTQYLSPWIARIVPASAFMQAVGVIEIVAGLLVLSKLTRIGAYVVAAWLVGIAVNLLTTGHFLDIAVRDAVMAVGAFTLARLSEVRAAVVGQASSSGRSVRSSSSSGPSGRQPAGGGLAMSASPARLTRSR